MELVTLDWVVLVLSIAVCFIPALLLARRAGRSTVEFFASGRAAPWWLVGISMVATTFSTDTPNLVTDIVRQDGVAGNWAWWAFLLTGMLTVFVYARLWRRSRVLTDLEFYEIRYGGKAASVVRGFRAIYLGLFFNCIVMASVNLAVAKIANVLLGMPMWQTLLACGVINVIFAATSGLWGVMVIDLIQFGIAMTGAIAVAYYALGHPEVGGLSGMVEQLSADEATTLQFLPDFGDWGLVVAVLLMPIIVQWWSVWYPGAVPGGGSYVAQRMLASRSERDALGGTLLFNIAHYALRPWPWIIVALCSLIIFPRLADIETMFPHVDPSLVGHDMAYPAMLHVLPAGFLGLMAAGLLAAYVSTISTHLNWGTSYIVHDFYRRFLKTDADEKHYVFMGRVVTVALMVIAFGVSLFMETARANFDLMLQVGAGTGLIYLLRWFWWRVNAWSEIVAMAVSFSIAVGFFFLNRHMRGLDPTTISSAWLDWALIREVTNIDGSAGLHIPSHTVLLITVFVTTIAWVATAYLAPPSDWKTLVRFYERVRPAGPGWEPVRRHASAGGSPDNLPQAMLAWVVSCLMVYSALFGTGSLLYGNWGTGIVFTVLFVASLIVLIPLLRSMWRAGESGEDNPANEGQADS